MDLLKTKSELAVAKTDLQTRLAVLQTKDGASAFVAERKAALEGLCAASSKTICPGPAGGRLTMKELVALELVRIEKFPNAVVKEEVQSLEKRLAVMENELEAIERAEGDLKPVDEGEVKR